MLTVAEFPPVNSGGLIEASIPMTWCTRSRARFRR